MRYIIILEDLISGELAFDGLKEDISSYEDMKDKCLEYERGNYYSVLNVLEFASFEFEYVMKPVVEDMSLRRTE